MDQITPLLRRIVAPNPGPMTGAGTNTYILGRGDVAVLDPGPDNDAHFAAILTALQPRETISHILVTHTHPDHCALAPRLVQATGAATAGFGPASHPHALQTNSGHSTIHPFAPDIHLADGDVLGGQQWQLRALHTPGHASNHLCFASDDVLFSGDHVMGWSTSLISPPDGDMAAYMAALARLQLHTWSIAHAGHGDAILDVPARLATLIAHRHRREAAILAAIGTQPQSLTAVTARAYWDVATHMLPVAKRNVLAHIIDLATRNLVIVKDPTSAEPSISRT